MGKLGLVAIIAIVVTVTYLLLLLVMPVLTGVVSTTNTTMHASSNMSNYPGTAEAVLSAPWILWFAPGVIGIALIVIILKSP